MHITIPETQLQGSALTSSCSADSLISPIDVTLGLALQTIMEPNTTKFVQKIQDCTQWAHKKADAFQAKEVQCNNINATMTNEVRQQPWKLQTQF